ncbi:MAG: sigma-70 family RNA polymerase sigma factor [Isosphaeraceae bacterium]
MSRDVVGAALEPERFRKYLLILARMSVNEADRARLDPSDVVQETLLNAHRKRDQFRGQTEAEMAAWLRAMLAFDLKDAHRALVTKKRGEGRDRSLEAALDKSSAQLGAWLIADQTSPSLGAERHERAIHVADALAELPEDQREALVLRYYDGLTVAEISLQMGRSIVAVAGLLKRGSKQLRTLLWNQE